MHFAIRFQAFIKEENMFGVGMPELIVILVIILIIFGAGKLPQIGEGLGEEFETSRKRPPKNRGRSRPKKLDDKKSEEK